MRNLIPFPAKIPDPVLQVLDCLQASGHEAYIVGGCVRDAFRGVEPHDWDICTSATPDEMVQHVFCGEHFIDEGSRKFGTVIFVKAGERYEVTTFREDGQYTDARHPASVTFSKSIITDLSRRDFTVNAIAYNFQNGVTDPFCGIEDIQAKCIRCVGDPYNRFKEDALRIMRALRFSSVFGYKIDPKTSEAIHALKDLLLQVSAERIRDELVKMLKGENVRSILVEYSDIITTIIPELKSAIGFEQNNPYHCYDVYRHIAEVVHYCRKTTDDTVTLVSALLHDIGKPHCYVENERGGHFYGHGDIGADIVPPIMRRLRFDNKSADAIEQMVRYHDMRIEPTKKSVRRLLSKVGEEQFERLLHLRLADIKGHTPDTQASRIERRLKMEECYYEIKAEQSCFSLKNLEVNGRDIMSECQISGGPMVGEILSYLLDEVMQENLPNEKVALLAAAKEYCVR